MIATENECLSLGSAIDFQWFSNREILVSGASGMLGSYFCSAMLVGSRLQGVAPPKFTLIVRSKESTNLKQFNREPNVEVIESELLEWIPDREFDFLIHAASPASPTKYQNSKSVTDPNVGWIEHLAKTRMPVKTLFVSSGEVYGPNAPKYVDENFAGNPIPDSPRAVYPLSKLAGESALSELFKRGSTVSYIARLFHTFGPGLRPDDGRSFSDFLWAAAMGMPIELRSSGEDIRTFLYVQDAIAGLLTILTKGDPGEMYNVGSDVPLKIIDFAEKVGRIGGVEVLSGNVDSCRNSDYIHSPNKSFIPSNKKLTSLGWSQVVSIEQGIESTLNWMKTRASNDRK